MPVNVMDRVFLSGNELIYKTVGRAQTVIYGCPLLADRRETEKMVFQNFDNADR